MKTLKYRLLTIVALLCGTVAAGQVRDARSADEEILIQRTCDYFKSNYDYINRQGAVVVIARADRVILCESFDADVNDSFNIGAVTQTFTSTLMAQAAGSKKLDWSARVSLLVPDFKLKDNFTAERLIVSDLCANNSGLRPCDTLPILLTGEDLTPPTVRLAETGQLFPYRTAYSENIALNAVAGSIVERATRSTWAETLQDSLLTPLGMAGTSVVAETGAYGPSVGLRSTAADMTTWLQLHLNNGRFGESSLINPSQMSRLHRGLTIEQQKPDSITLYGYGWHISQSKLGRVFYACGEFDHQACACCFLPYADLAIMVAGVTGMDRNACLDALWRIIDLAVTPR